MRLEGRVALGRLMRLVAGVDIARGHQRGIRRLGEDDLRLGALAPQHPTDAGDGAAGAVAADEVVQPLAGEIGLDLAPGGRFVDVRIRGRLELAGEEPSMRLGQLLGLDIHAVALLRAGRQHHLGAEEPHQPPPLDRKALGHGHDQRIALGRADHGEADAGVARGRLDHRLAGLQPALALGRLDDAERQPVLDRSGRVEGLEFDVGRDMGQRDPVDADHRRVAHRLEDAVIAAAAAGGGSRCHDSPRLMTREAGVPA